MTRDSKIDLCFPCGYFRPGDPEDPIAGDYQEIDGAIWPKTADQFWEKLRTSQNKTVAASAGGTLAENGSIRITCLNETWSADTKERRVTKLHDANAEPSSDWIRQLPFLILVYLASAQRDPATYDMVIPRDLFKGFDLFRGNLDREMQRVEKTYGNDGEGFSRAARLLGGESAKAGDVAARFHFFPKFPVDYILWLGDSEFPAGLTVLVDRSATLHLSADAIGVALNLLSRRLCWEALRGTTKIPRVSSNPSGTTRP
jgi:hypothetical protein